MSDTRVAELEAENQRLREALQPFAAVSLEALDCRDDRLWVTCIHDERDVWRARHALAGVMQGWECPNRRFVGDREPTLSGASCPAMSDGRSPEGHAP